MQTHLEKGYWTDLVSKLNAGYSILETDSLSNQAQSRILGQDQSRISGLAQSRTLGQAQCARSIWHSNDIVAYSETRGTGGKSGDQHKAYMIRIPDTRFFHNHGSNIK